MSDFVFNSETDEKIRQTSKSEDKEVDLSRRVPTLEELREQFPEVVERGG